MALLAKLRPTGPWRVGPDTGDRLRVGRVLHSDALYSALSHAFIELGEFDAWLEATAARPSGSEVRLSSCFPFVTGEQGDTLFLPPPDSHWPPPNSLRIRWKSARFVPPTAVWQLLNDKPLIEEHWVVDGVSECLIPVIRNVPLPSPFRVTVRSRAAVDRLGQGIEPHQTACLEFSKGAGIWTAFTFASVEAEARWSPSIKGALKLIADSGLGGERSSGWGRFEQPEFAEGELGALLFGNRYRAPEEVTGHWLLSLFSPAPDDGVNWQEGAYRVVARTGRVESRSGWGASKRANNMIAEGAVLVAPSAPKGVARDVAPEGFPHPVYRAGFALTLPIGKPKPPKPVPPAVTVPSEGSPLPDGRGSEGVAEAEAATTTGPASAEVPVETDGAAEIETHASVEPASAEAPPSEPRPSGRGQSHEADTTAPPAAEPMLIEAAPSTPDTALVGPIGTRELVAPAPHEPQPEIAPEPPKASE